MRLLTIAERKKSLKSELRRMENIVIRKYHPEMIVLFGSLATGKIDAWSDIDLLIIKQTNKRPVDRCLEIAKLVKPKVGVDLLVYTPDEYNLLLKEKFTLLREILKKGKVLYEKRD